MAALTDKQRIDRLERAVAEMLPHLEKTAGNPWSPAGAVVELHPRARGVHVANGARGFERRPAAPAPEQREAVA